MGFRSKLKRVITCVLFPAALMGAAGSLSADDTAGVMPYPEPGTYELQRIQEVPFAMVVDGSGLPSKLEKFTTDKITLLTFFYATCRDPKGCPLLWDVFFKIRDKIKEDPTLRDHVQLVFFSFDPKNDIPETLQLFTDLENQDDSLVPWHFITSYDIPFLMTTLDGFSQPIYRDRDKDGNVVINHSLKVFLIDPDGYVREIYASNLLDPKVIVGDIKTLALEDAAKNVGQ